MAPSERNFPSGWERFNNHAQGGGVAAFGFSGSTGDVNRFGARFRVAKSFRSVTLDGFADSTTRGYTALVRATLVYSAFEAFLDISGGTQAQTGKQLEAFGATTLASKIRKMDVDGRFYQFVQERCNGAHKRELESYFHEDPFNVTYLLSAVRHGFAHGWLTPNVNKIEPRVVIAICDALSGFILRYMDATFWAHIESAYEDWYGR